MSELASILDKGLAFIIIILIFLGIGIWRIGDKLKDFKKMSERL